MYLGGEFVCVETYLNSYHSQAEQPPEDDSCWSDDDHQQLKPDGLLTALLKRAEGGEQKHDERQREGVDERVFLGYPCGDGSAEDSGCEGVAQINEEVTGAWLAGCGGPFGHEFCQGCCGCCDENGHGGKACE